MILRGVTAIALLWLASAAIIAGIRASAPTVASVTDFATQRPLEGKSDAEREEVVGSLVRRIALLDYSQQRATSAAPPVRRFYTSLTSAEKERFLHLLMPSAVRNIFLATCAQPAADREKFFNEALYELETTRGKDESATVNEERVQRWMNAAAHEAFFSTPLSVRGQLKPILDRSLPGFLPPP